MNLCVSEPPYRGSPASRFESASALAFNIAESDKELIEPELLAWVDHSAGQTSPELEGCSGPAGRHDYGVTHDGRLEVRGGGDISFIFTDSSPYDSYEHFAPGPFINVRDAQ